MPWIERVDLELVDLQDWRGELAFVDVGALVYYLKAVPWLVEGFSVATHAETLLRMYEKVERDGKLVYSARKYLIEARRGADC